MKKILAILLSFMMMLSLVPSLAFAEEELTIVDVDIPLYHVYDCSNSFPYPDVTVTYSDGSSEVITEQELWEEHSFDWDLFWGIDTSLGEHDANFELDYFSGTFKYVVEEFPFVSFEASDVVVESYNFNYGMEAYRSYNEGTSEYIEPYFAYEPQKHYFIFKKANGETVPLTEEELEYEYKIVARDSFNEMQEEIEFVPGDYYPELTIGTLKATYRFHVNDFIFKSISASDVSVMEYTNGTWMTGTYDDDYNFVPYEEPYFQYYIQPDFITVEYLDGKKRNLSVEELFDMGYYPNTDKFNFDDDNKYEVGTYDCTLYLMPLETTYKVNILEIPENPLPIKNRLSYQIMAYIDSDEEWGAYRLSNNLAKMEYNEKENKVVVTVKTEDEFIKEGHTKEEYLNLLTAGGKIKDPSKWAYTVEVDLDRPDSKSNPIFKETENKELYGETYLKHFDEIDKYLEDPDSFEYFDDWANSVVIASLDYKVNINGKNVTFTKKEEIHYGVVWKAEEPIEEIIDVTFHYQKSPETLTIDYSLYIAILSFIALVVCGALYRRKENN